jgi:hypothetical protein
MHRALGFLLARHEDMLNVRAGSVFTLPIGADLVGKEMRIAAPGQNLEQAPARQLETNAQVPVVRHEQTEIAGAYRVHFPEDPAAGFRFAVQADPAESALRELAPRDLQSLREVAPVIRWTPAADLRATIQHERTGTELWMPILVAVLGLVLAETVLGNRWSRSR